MNWGRGIFKNTPSPIKVFHDMDDIYSKRKISFTQGGVCFEFLYDGKPEYIYKKSGNADEMAAEKEE